MITAYACLVGIPLLGLIGIVRAGRRLVAPLSVGGNWNIEADFALWADKPCGDLLAGARQPALSISQSGDRLVIALNNRQATELIGTIRATFLRAGSEDPPASGIDNCSAAQPIGVTATVKNQGEQRTLTGTLRLNTCEACPPVAFRAVRQPAQKKDDE